MILRLKRFGVLVVAFLFVLCLAGCGKSTLTPSEVSGYWIVQNPGDGPNSSFEKELNSGILCAYVLNEEGLFTFLINTKETGSIVWLGHYEIEGDKVIVDLPEYGDSKTTGSAIENAEITIEGDTLTAEGFRVDGAIVKAKKSSYEEYQALAEQARSHW